MGSSAQTFAIDAYFNCLYIDPKVRANHSKFFKGKYINPETAQEYLDWDNFPVFHFVNNVEKSEEIDQIITIYGEPSTGYVNVQRRYILRFDFSAEVHAFPFDEQKLRARLLFNPCYHLLVSRDMPTAAFAGAVRSQEWSIVRDEEDRLRITEGFDVFKGASGIEYSQYTIELTALRKPGQYIWSYVLPISVLTLLGLPTFLLPVADLGDRMAGIMTVLLTMSAIKIAVNSSTPAVNYLTSLDKFLILTFMLVALAGVESAVVSQVHEDTQAHVDTAAFRGYLLAWVCIHLFGVCDVHCSRKKARRKDEAEEITPGGLIELSQ